MNWSNFYPQLFGFLISFENFFILLIILGYGNDKLRNCALSISHLRRHPYVLLPIIIIIIITIIIIIIILIIITIIIIIIIIIIISRH